MQMIDLMKRLAELDAKKSNNVKQGMKEGLDECGIMPASSSMGMPRTPASIHITADSGSELTAMLRDIASLAGMKDHHTGGDDSILPGNGSLEIEPLSVEPTDMGPPEPSMRSMIDKLNPSDEKAEETINSEPDPMSAGKVPANQDPAGTPGAAQGRNQMNNPVATPMSSEEEVYETLKQDYQKFLTDARYGGRSSWDTSSTGWQSDEERRGRYKERDFAHGAQDIEPETKTPAPKGMLYGFYDALGQKWLSSQSGQSPIKVPRRVAYDDSDATKGILGFNNKEAAEKAKNSVTPLMSRDSNPHPYSVELFRSTENGLSDVKELDEQMVEDSHNRLREGNEKSDPEADDFYNFANLYSNPDSRSHPDPMEAVRLITAQGKDPEVTAQNIISFAKSNPDEVGYDSAVSIAIKDLESAYPQEESLEDFFSKLRSEVEDGENVVDTFHDKVDQLEVKLPDEVLQYLRDQSAEADGNQDDPAKMKSIMLAAIDEVEKRLGLKNTMEPGTQESQDILRLAGIR